jgi:T-box protein 20
MFPTVRCSFSNLRPDKKYWVLIDIVPCDNKRYRYAYHRSSWLVAGKADPPPPHRLYAHPDAPYSGEQLRKQVVSFEKVKLTNNEMDKNGQVQPIQFVSITIINNSISYKNILTTFSSSYFYTLNVN